MHLLRSSLLLLSSALLPSLLSATPIDNFHLTGNGLDLSFSIAATPTVSYSYSDLGFFLDNVKLTANGKNYTARLQTSF